MRYLILENGVYGVVASSKKPKSYVADWPEDISPSDLQYCDIIIGEDGKVHGIILDQGKKTADTSLKDKEDQIKSELVSAGNDLYSKVYETYQTADRDAIAADMETYKLMSSSPELYDGTEKTFARMDAGRFTKGDTLDTASDIKEFADAALSKIASYSVYRINRIKQRDDAIALIQED